MLDLRLLMDLGLAPKEAEIVVHMANSLRERGKGYFVAPVLAKEVGIPREKIYTYLKRLEELGVIDTIGSRPKSFSLRPVDELLDGLARSHRERVEGNLVQLEATVAEAKRSEYASLLPRLSILKDRGQYVRAMIEIIKSSKQVMIISRTSALLLPWSRESGPVQLLDEYRNSIIERTSAGSAHVDYLIPFEYTKTEILGRAGASMVEARRAIANLEEFCLSKKHPNIRVRNMSRVPAISLIIGEGRVAVGFTSEEEARTAKGVMVESGDFFGFMSSIYDLLVDQEGSDIGPEMVEEIGMALDRIGRERIQGVLRQSSRGSD
ncbi:MAG: hypothetical protein HXS50_01085 [Theionarchaea archaeon]|nr:hypothetical protein [Theionarchaea archaeon]